MKRKEKKRRRIMDWMLWWNFKKVERNKRQKADQIRMKTFKNVITCKFYN